MQHVVNRHQQCAAIQQRDIELRRPENAAFLGITRGSCNCSWIEKIGLRQSTSETLSRCPHGKPLNSALLPMR
jgi:hypothetical protein